MATRSIEAKVTSGGANTKPETTEVMELSSEIGFLTLRKHKDENSATADSTTSEDVDKEVEKEEEEVEEEEDEDEEEEEEEEEEEVVVDSCESDQEWDVDSFAEVDFHSSDEPEDEDWRRYARQCYKSEGFDVDYDILPPYNPDTMYSGFNPITLDNYFSPPDLTGRQFMEIMLKVVIDKYNETKNKNLVMDHIVRAVVKMSIGCKAYITFMARESPEGELVEYQGKVQQKAWQKNFHPLLCRPASEQKSKYQG